MQRGRHPPPRHRAHAGAAHGRAQGAGRGTPSRTPRRGLPSVSWRWQVPRRRSAPATVARTSSASRRACYFWRRTRRIRSLPFRHFWFRSHGVCTPFPRIGRWTICISARYAPRAPRPSHFLSHSMRSARPAMSLVRRPAHPERCVATDAILHATDTLTCVGCGRQALRTALASVQGPFPSLAACSACGNRWRSP